MLGYTHPMPPTSTRMEMKKQEAGAPPKKSQAELRAALERKILAEKPRLDHAIEEYRKALADNVFEDHDGEDEGSGEKRQTAMQQRILSTIERAENIKKILKSGERLEDTPTINPDALTLTNEPFMSDTLTGWYGADAGKAKQEAIITDPSSQAYEALSQDTVPAEFGKYTLNPETQGLNFEQAKAFIPDLSAFTGKPLHEVMQHVATTYATTHHLPGIEYWKWLYENPGKSPQHLKDGKYYFFPGSVLRDHDGDWDVPHADWRGASFNRDADWLTRVWFSGYRVVLLEK